MTGLEKLREITRMTEEYTGGKQQFAGDFMGGVYIRQEDDAAVGMQMRKNYDHDNDCCRLEFTAYVRRMGVNMSSSGMRKTADEMSKMAELLDRLEQKPVIATEEEMTAWSREITAMQVTHAIEQSRSAESPGISMKMDMG